MIWVINWTDRTCIGGGTPPSSASTARSIQARFVARFGALTTWFSGGYHQLRLLGRRFRRWLSGSGQRGHEYEYEGVLEEEAEVADRSIELIDSLSSHSPSLSPSRTQPSTRTYHEHPGSYGSIAEGEDGIEDNTVSFSTPPGPQTSGRSVRPPSLSSLSLLSQDTSENEEARVAMRIRDLSVSYRTWRGQCTHL